MPSRSLDAIVAPTPRAKRAGRTARVSSDSKPKSGHFRASPKGSQNDKRGRTARKETLREPSSNDRNPLVVEERELARFIEVLHAVLIVVHAVVDDQFITGALHVVHARAQDDECGGRTHKQRIDVNRKRLNKSLTCGVVHFRRCRGMGTRSLARFI